MNPRAVALIALASTTLALVAGGPADARSSERPARPRTLHPTFVLVRVDDLRWDELWVDRRSAGCNHLSS